MDVDYGPPTTLPAPLAERMVATPDAIAVVDDAGRMTYRQVFPPLAEQARVIAELEAGQAADTYAHAIPVEHATEGPEACARRRWSSSRRSPEAAWATEDECVAHIDRIWVDICPRSLREQSN
jgi:hypothetical protein